MTGSPTQTASAERPDLDFAEDNEPHRDDDAPPAASLKGCTLAGVGAALLLSVIEWIDLQIQLTPVFASASERFIFTAYFSLNLIVGAAIGLLVGLSAHLARWANRRLLRVIARSKEARLFHIIISSAIIALVAAALLYLQPAVFKYVLGMIREAEKIALARVLLKAEHLFTYLAIVGLVVSCAILWAIARASRSMPSLIRYILGIAMALVIAVAYYIDSRIEVQQYQYSLHRTMFLITFSLSMSLVASLLPSLARFSLPHSSARTHRKRIITSLLALSITAAALFTFFYFDRNQNLKTQLFFRSTQAKQFFSLAQYALDFDRDGYSSLLGGGDSDDLNSAINPARPEVAGDMIDNNCIGGDISQDEVSDWLLNHQQLNSAANDAAKPYNVIFIFVDTVRADHLSAYGYERDTSPNLSKLAHRSALFVNAFTPSPSTYQAVPKFMQSSLWDAHIETWTEVLARSGYETVLYPARRASTLYRRIKDPRLINSARTNNVKETVDVVIEKLNQAPPDRPACYYLYAFEPHVPYRVRHDFYFGSGLADHYDGEIAYVDHHLGRLFDWLYQSGKINDTIIVVMSDHGESLGERGVYKHNAQLYNEQMRVPMIIHVPGFEPRRIEQYVSTIDLGSTILNAVGISPPKDYAGTSLIPLMRDDSFIHPPVFGEHWQRNDSPFWGPERNVDPEIRKYMVITQDGFKLIHSDNYNTFELYDLKSDPKEERNLYNEMPEKSAEMKRLLGRFVDVVSISRPPDADEQRFFRGQRDD